MHQESFGDIVAINADDPERARAILDAQQAQQTALLEAQRRYLEERIPLLEELDCDLGELEEAMAQARRAKGGAGDPLTAADIRPYLVRGGGE